MVSLVLAISFWSFRWFRFGRFGSSARFGVSFWSFRWFRFGGFGRFGRFSVFVLVVSLVSVISVVSFRSFRFVVLSFSTCLRAVLLCKTWSSDMIVELPLSLQTRSP